MRGYRWFMGSALVVAAVLAVVQFGPWLYYAWVPRTASELKQRFDRLEIGMTVDAVRGVLGPESREAVESDFTQRTEQGLVPCARGERILVWDKPGSVTLVGFTNGVVVSRHLFEHEL